MRHTRQQKLRGPPAAPATRHGGHLSPGPGRRALACARLLYACRTLCARKGDAGPATVSHRVAQPVRLAPGSSNLASSALSTRREPIQNPALGRRQPACQLPPPPPAGPDGPRPPHAVLGLPVRCSEAADMRSGAAGQAPAARGGGSAAVQPQPAAAHQVSDHWSAALRCCFSTGWALTNLS